MWQRIQTLYYGFAAIILGTLLFGIELFGFRGESFYYRVSAYGIEKLEINADKSFGDVIELWAVPFYFVLISLILLVLMTALSFKNLNRQFKLARTLFFVYLLLVVGVVVYAMVGVQTDEEVKRELGLGFFLFVVGFPFTFLGQIGVKRDKTLIDSLNRLR